MQSLKSVVEKIHNYKDSVSGELDPNRDMYVDRSDLNGEFLRQSALAASYGFLYSTAEAEVNHIDFQLSVVQANLDKKIRAELSEKGRVTEKMVEHEVFLNEDYQEKKKELITAKETKRLLKAACDALDHKLQALINAGADHRKSSMDYKILEQDSKTF